MIDDKPFTAILTLGFQAEDVEEADSLIDTLVEELWEQGYEALGTVTIEESYGEL